MSETSVKSSNSKSKTTKNRAFIYDMVLISISAALIAVCSWISIPLGPVPFTLQTLGILAVMLTAGGRRGTIAVLVYLALGAVGVPVFAGFKGGKGVATGLGVLLGINPLLGFFVLLTWLVVAFLTRYSSLSALVSAALAPVYYGLMFRVDAFFYAICVISALLIYRHRQNIANLLAGTESKIGSKKKAV